MEDGESKVLERHTYGPHVPSPGHRLSDLSGVLHGLQQVRFLTSALSVPALTRLDFSDGIGDLPGILSKLDYVKSLGVDAVWISPFYASPNEDQGYDISDYQNPAPEYGKLSDVEAIIKGCHDRGLAVLFDLVINHTSDQHRWFQEARKSKDNPYRKYYIWREARYTADCNRIEPSNWLALFGGSAWEWDDHTREYYLHCFLKSQPDLNWEDEEVRKAIYKESIEYWLEKGVDGMRIDVANLYSKWPVEDVEVTRPGEYLQPAATKYVDGPRLVELTKEMTAVFAKYGCVCSEEGGWTELILCDTELFRSRSVRASWILLGCSSTSRLKRRCTTWRSLSTFFESTHMVKAFTSTVKLGSSAPSSRP